MRIVARVVASILIFAGLIAVAAAVITMKVIGKDNVITMQPSVVRTNSAAITTAKGLLSVYGSDLHIRVNSRDPDARLWLGVAYDLDNYLGDTSRTEIISYGYPHTLGTYDHTGEDVPLASPAGLDWWLASAHGTGSVELVWRMRNAPCGIVIMNQSGAPKLDTAITFGLQVRGVYETAELVGVGGVIAIVAGILICLLTRRRPSEPVVEVKGERS